MTSTRTLAISEAYCHQLKRQWRALVMLYLLAVFIQGCAASIPPQASLQTEPWQWHEISGRAVMTAHYRILTTIADDETLQRFTRLMESAYVQYAALFPVTNSNDRPLEIDLFAKPEEWERFTRETAGPDAAIYLQVNQGGYTIGDRFVCWLASESDLYSVAAHEGFHQFVARHFKDRPPPAIEEGIATLFETVTVTEQAAYFDLHQNARRERGIARGIEENLLLPLETLIQLHAGDVVSGGSDRSEAFYGQCWALVRMLLESPKYRPQFLQMLADLRDGKSRVNLGPNTHAGIYRPLAIKPLLQAYVAADWKTFNDDFQHFCRTAINGQSAPE